MTNTTTEHADGHAAAAFYGNGLSVTRMATLWRSASARPSVGCGPAATNTAVELYRHIHWIPLTADDASGVQFDVGRGAAAMTELRPAVGPCSAAPGRAPEARTRRRGAPAAVTHAPDPSLASVPPGKRLALALRTLRWTYGTLAIELGLSPSTTRNWGLGRQPLPAAVLRWVELLAEFHRNVPPPR